MDDPLSFVETYQGLLSVIGFLGAWGVGCLTILVFHKLS